MNRREMAVMVAAATTLAAGPAEAAQPHMEAALQKCRSALSELKAAKPNKGGHRNKAIEHLEFVIHEIQAGIAYAD